MTLVATWLLNVMVVPTLLVPPPRTIPLCMLRNPLLTKTLDGWIGRMTDTMTTARAPTGIQTGTGTILLVQTTIGTKPAEVALLTVLPMTRVTGMIMMKMIMKMKNLKKKIARRTNLRMSHRISQAALGIRTRRCVPVRLVRILRVARAIPMAVAATMVTRPLLLR